MQLAAGSAHDLDEKPGEGGLRLEGGPALAGEAARHHIHPATRRRLHGRVQEGVAPAAAVHRGSGGAGRADLQADVLEPAQDALLGTLCGQDGQRYDYEAEPPLHLVEARQVHAGSQQCSEEWVDRSGLRRMIETFVNSMVINFYKGE